MFDLVYGVTYNIIAMKNRVLLTMLILFIVLSSVWITCGTIFVVREIEIIDSTVTTAELLTDTEKNEIIKQSGLMGKNILFNINQDKIAEGIKTVNPMIKLQSVTAEFPNRVLLNVSRRVPVYYDEDNFYDAEMCVVDASPNPNCVDISGAKLNLSRNDYKTGEIITGKDERDQCKIEQLKIIATMDYFQPLDGVKIEYNDTAEEVGAYRVCLILKIDQSVTFKIKVKFDENFLHALDYTIQYYEERNKMGGTYITEYDEVDHRLKTHKE